MSNSRDSETASEYEKICLALGFSKTVPLTTALLQIQRLQRCADKLEELQLKGVAL